MAKPFDATTRKLMEMDPGSWLACAGLPETGPVRLLDSDVSTITAEADAIFQVGEPADYLAHVELQSSHDRALPRRLLHYNVLVHYRHEVPVRSVVVLLRRGADSPTFTGHHQVILPDGSSYLDFRYDVLRLWTLDPEIFLKSGPGVLPLAPLADVDEARLPSIINRIKARLDREVSETEAGLLWTATSVLMGLKFSGELSQRLLQGVQHMKESVTYQAIVEEGVAKGVLKGRVEAEQEILLELGRSLLGEPSNLVVDQIQAMVDESEVRRLIKATIKMSSWDELLRGVNRRADS